MDAIVDDLALSIIIWFDPHSLSNISLVNTRYYDLLHGNSVLMLLSVRHDFKFESFEEYQLFCELRYLVPQASKHYDMNYYKLSMDRFNCVLDVDKISEYLRSSHGYYVGMYDDVSSVILKCMYEEGAHTTGNLKPNDPKIKELYKLHRLKWYAAEYLIYLAEHCPDTKIIIQYWNKCKDEIINDDEYDEEEFSRELFNGCISSVYCAERLHWFRSIDPIRAHDYLCMVETPHSYIIHYMINNCSIKSKRYAFNNIPDLSMGELIAISNKYKHSERVNRLVQKMLI